MLPDLVSNPGPLTYESGALPIALRGPALIVEVQQQQSFLKGVKVLLQERLCSYSTGLLLKEFCCAGKPNGSYKSCSPL